MCCVCAFVSFSSVCKCVRARAQWQEFFGGVESQCFSQECLKGSKLSQALRKLFLCALPKDMTIDVSDGLFRDKVEKKEEEER